MISMRVCSRSELFLDEIQDRKERKRLEKERREDLLEVLQTLMNEKSNIDSLGYLRRFHDLVCQEGYSYHMANKSIVDEAIHNMDAGNSATQRQAQILREHYHEGLTLAQLGARYDLTADRVDRRLGLARKRLLIEIAQIDEVSRRRHRDKQFQQLAMATDKELIGPSTERKRLKDYIQQKGAPYLIAIKGLGGSGKTVQTTSVIREIIPEDLFDEFIWIDVKQKVFTPDGRRRETNQPALTLEVLVEELLQRLQSKYKNAQSISMEIALHRLREHFNKHPCLICIDNIEEAPDITALLPELERIVNPSKVIFITRVQILSYELPIAHIEVPELSKSDALQLMRESSYLKGLHNVSNMEDEALVPVYDIVQGNPLALELLLGLINEFGIEAVLSMLREPSGTPSEELFHHIYTYDWRNLKSPANIVLSALLLVQPQGGDYALLSTITELNSTQLQSALKELIHLSLIQTAGHGSDIRYTVHGLTRSFLEQEQIRDNNGSATKTNIFAGFSRYVINGLEDAYAKVTSLVSGLSNYNREQALHIWQAGLELSLDDKSIWSATSKLFMALTEQAELTGFHDVWIRYYVKPAIEMSRKVSDLKHEALLQIHLGRLYRRGGQYEEAHSLLSASRRYFEGEGDADNLLAAIVQQAHIYALQREHEAAEPLLKQAYEILSVTDSRLEYVYFIEGVLALNNRDGKSAEELFGKSLKHCEAQGDKRWIATRLGNLATALYTQNQLEQALAYYERAKNLFDEVRDYVQKAMMMIGIACVYIDQERSEKALEAFAEAEPILRNAHEVLHVGMLNLNQAICLKRLERWQEAEECFVHALTWYNILNDHYRCANANLELGMLYEEQGFKPRARRAYQDGLDHLNHCEQSSGRDELEHELRDRIAGL